MALKYCRVKHLRFEDYVQRIAGKASQRMYVVKKMLHLSPKPLAFMMFKSCVVSLFMYLLSACFAHEHMYHRQEITKESF